MYARLYSACLLELGFRVLLIEDRNSGVKDWLHKNVDVPLANFSCWHIGAADRARLPAYRRALLVWQSEGVIGILLRLKWYIRGAFDRLRQKSTQYPRGEVALRPLVREIDVATRRLHVAPDLILFLYLDMIREDWFGCRALRRLTARWAGILFHPRLGGAERSAERYFNAPNAGGAAFLNENSVPDYMRRFPRLVFTTFPDVTNTAVLAEGSELTNRLAICAAGRKVILQIGSISPHKGVLDFVAAVKRADPKQLFFALVGEVFWEMFGADAEGVRAFVRSPPENCLVQIGYLQDERELNSMIATADILYAVYRNFQGSSNTLTKAAFFEKPVLVSDQHVMGERVKRFRLGETVRYGDVMGIISKLGVLCERSRDQFGFEAYRQEHSIEVLKRRLSEVVPRWMNIAGRSPSPTTAAESG
jgi:hypothetical protein